MMDYGGFNGGGGNGGGFNYAYPTLDAMSQGQYGQSQQQQQPTGAYQFRGGFTPMISDATTPNNSYQPAPSVTNYNMASPPANVYSPTHNLPTDIRSSPTYTLPQQTQSAPQQQQQQQQQQGLTTPWTDPYGRPISGMGQYFGNTALGGQSPYTYQGFQQPQNGLGGPQQTQSIPNNYSSSNGFGYGGGFGLNGGFGTGGGLGITGRR